MVSPYDAVMRAQAAGAAVQANYLLAQIGVPYRAVVPFTGPRVQPKSGVYVPAWALPSAGYQIGVPAPSQNGLSPEKIYSDVAGFFSSGVQASQAAAQGSQAIGIGSGLIGAALLLAVGTVAYKVLK